MASDIPKAVLEMVVTFGRAAGSCGADPWSSLLLSLSNLIQADGHALHPKHELTSGSLIDEIIWGDPLDKRDAIRITGLITGSKPGVVLNIKDPRTTRPVLLIVQEDSTVFFYRKPGSAAFGAARVSVVASVIAACSAASAHPSLSSLPSNLQNLPTRLRQVLRGILVGQSDKEIATDLRLSVNTIHVYLKSLFNRSGVKSRYELISRCLRFDRPINGLIPLPGLDFRSGDQQGQVPQGQFHPSDQIIPSPDPVPPVDRAGRDMPLRDRQSPDQLFSPRRSPEDVRPFRSGHRRRINPTRRF